MVCKPTASASCVNFLEKQILSPNYRFQNGDAGDFDTQSSLKTTII